MSETDLAKLADLIADRLNRVQPAWLSPVQAAVYTGIAEKTLEQYRRDGGGPAFSRVGRLVRYSRTDLDNFMRGITHA